MHRSRKRSPNSAGVRKSHQVWSPDSEHAYAVQRIRCAEGWNRRSLHAFARWLSADRGLCPGSITVRIHSASTFVDAMTERVGCSCARAFGLIGADEIEEFFVAYAKGHGRAALRSMQAAMRLFLRFSNRRGWVASELIEAVPSCRSYRLSGLVRSVSEEELSKLLESPWKDAHWPFLLWECRQRV